jgi:hypothetical protein
VGIWSKTIVSLVRKRTRRLRSSAILDVCNGEPDPARDHRRSDQIFLVIIFIGLVLAWAEPCLATEKNDTSEVFDFDVPEQSLVAALQSFMSISNIAVVVDGAMVGKRRSNAIRGTFSPESALQSLLDGTGLDSRWIGPGVYTLELAPHRVEARPRFVDYAAAVQRAVMLALCRVDETNPLRYRTVIRLWLQPEGTAKQVKLAVSTGSPSDDAAITNTLQRLDVGSPVPANLPQPIKLAIAPRAIGSANCPDHAGVRSSPQRGTP